MLSAKTFVRESEMKNSNIMECNICASEENESKVIPYYRQSWPLNHTALIQIILYDKFIHNICARIRDCLPWGVHTEGMQFSHKCCGA